MNDLPISRREALPTHFRSKRRAGKGTPKMARGWTGDVVEERVKQETGLEREERNKAQKRGVRGKEEREKRRRSKQERKAEGDTSGKGG